MVAKVTVAMVAADSHSFAIDPGSDWNSKNW